MSIYADQSGTIQPASSGPPRQTSVVRLRTGAFSQLRTRWLVLWAMLGTGVVVGIIAAVGALAGEGTANDWFGVLAYLPIVAWLAVMVVRRGGIDLRAMLRWPRLGAYWWVVSGLFVLQYLFSLAAILITQLLVPSLGDALEGVGEGSLLLAIIGLAILPPLVEEVLFRGVLIERFAVKWRLGVAVVVSAVLFGILHVDPVGAGVFGVITGLLYLRTGSLWPGILIHGVNNLVALVAMRLAPDEEPAAVPVGETLMAAVVLLVVTVPFLIWYCRATWPRAGTLTPYQRHELATGMPARTFHRAYWSQAPGQLRLEVGAMHLAVSQDIPGSAPFALLALDRVSVAYPIDVPGGQQVVVLLRDGSWTTMTVGGGLRAPTHLLADAINERCASAALGAGSSAVLHN